MRCVIRYREGLCKLMEVKTREKITSALEGISLDIVRNYISSWKKTSANLWKDKGHI